MAGCTRVGGFSLIELLVAVAIFAVASAMAWAGIAALTRSQERLADAQDAFAAVQRSVGILAGDLRTAVDRPARVERNGRQPALSGSPQRVAFTRLGTASQLRASDSALERVVWFVDGEALVRGHYSVLDRLGNGVLNQRILSEKVEEFRLRYLDRQGAWHDQWPPVSSGGLSEQSGLPQAVEFHAEFPGLGDVRRIIELPSARPAVDLAPGGES